MKNILVIGSTGQIGSELTMKLRRDIPGSTVVAGYIPGAEPHGELLESGPAERADVRDAQGLADIAGRYHIDTVYNLAALLSAVAEKKPLMAWERPDQYSRSGPRAPYGGVYAEFHRLFRPLDAPSGHAPGHHPASAFHVRRDQGRDGTPQ